MQFFHRKQEKFIENGKIQGWPPQDSRFAAKSKNLHPQSLRFAVKFKNLRSQSLRFAKLSYANL